MAQIRNNPDSSSYFQGGFRAYGAYRWNMKFGDWQDDQEIEDARQWAFGEYIHKRQAFENINDIIGRSEKAPWVKCGFEGRSGGWFCVYEELDDDELQKLDEHIKNTMEGLPEFVRTEREFHAEMQREEEEAECKKRQEILSNPKLSRVITQVRKLAGGDNFKLVIKGVDVMEALQDTILQSFIPRR